jgi:hypothetical protein
LAKLFHLIYHLIAAIVALGRIALGVFIIKFGAQRCQHVLRDIIFGRDQVNHPLLP